VAAQKVDAWVGLKETVTFLHSMPEPVIITLDGNIGAGKSTLLEAIRVNLPNVTVIPEPVGEWLTMTNESGESLLSLFYKDKRRWAYTFQNAAILTRLTETMKILKEYYADPTKPHIIITERSVLTDRHVFAEMLHRQGYVDDLEWNLYMKWFNSFAADIPVRGIIHLATSATTSKERIGIRGRSGEEGIPLEYLDDLDAQHKLWIESSHLPCLQITTEPGTDMNAVVAQVNTWVCEHFMLPKEHVD
jgi:deoxyadenosine/deoxycytidine kinase